MTVGFVKREYAALSLLILIVLALHLSTIFQPKSPVFDEKFYIPAARTILAGQGTTIVEHPPLAQLIIASGIRIFGDNPFGWRIFPVIFGLAGIILFYLICRRLGLDRKYAYLAAFFLSFENLSFVQSSVAMLDVFSLTFMLAAFWLYLRGQYAGSGAMAALGMLSKMTGLLAIPIIIVHWLLTDRRSWKKLIIFLVAALAAFWLLMPLLDYLVWHQWLDPFSQVRTMLDINASATFARHAGDPMLSRPWDWLLYPVILTYWISPHYVSMISPPVWALMIPAVIFLIYKTRKRDKAALFALFWFAGTYLIWIPSSLITNRISYIYYIYPALGSVCLALSLAAAELEKFQASGKFHKWTGLILPFFMVLCLIAFAVLSPVAYWWKLPLCVAAYAVSRSYLSGELSARVAVE